LAAGRPILEWALDGLASWPSSARHVFVARPAPELEKYINAMLAPQRALARVTCMFAAHRGGELESVLTARHAIAPDEPLLIASSNVYVESNLAEVVAGIGEEVRAIVLVSALGEPQHQKRWEPHSLYTRGDVVEVGTDGGVVSMAGWSPAPIFEATGTYYFARAADFIELGSDIQRRNIRADGELRIRSVFEAYLHRNWRVEAAVAKAMWPIRSIADAIRFEHWRDVPNNVLMEQDRRSRAFYTYGIDWLVPFPTFDNQGVPRRYRK
jgi:hypothetical protein